MKRKVLCIALALLMCMMVTLPTFADGSNDASQERVGISATFGLKHVSGSSYKIWAKIINPDGANVSATLALYDVSYNYITSVGIVSSDPLISLSKSITLSSGTYHVRLNYTVNGSIYSWEKTYNI